MNAATITFDGKQLFGTGEHVVWPLAWQRATVDRGFAGLDGIFSVDLGRRGRTIKQRGHLAAASAAALASLMDQIAGYVDGHAYELVDQNGVTYANVRMDSFTPASPVRRGSQVRCEYEIVYTQLRCQ